MEEEENGSLPFMDIRFSRQNNNHLAREVYKKPTNTSHYVTYDSHHPTSVKSSIVPGLAQRAIMVSSDAISRDKELPRISMAIAWNSYPKKFVDKGINRQMRRSSTGADPGYVPCVRERSLHFRFSNFCYRV